MHWGSTRKGKRRLKTSEDRIIVRRIQVRSRADGSEDSEGSSFNLISRLLFYTHAGPSQLSLAWQGPFNAIPSIWSETCAVCITSMIWAPIIRTAACC